MQEDLDSIKNIVMKYVRELQIQKIAIDKVFLFGSYAKGNYSDNSDIDIAIISKDFSGDRFDDRHKIAPSIFKIDSRIDPFPFRPEDFNMKDPLAIEIANTGITIPD